MSDIKVTLNPSDEIIAQANTEVTVTDSNGHIIKLKKPGILAQFRLVEALGDLAKNQVYMSMSLPLFYISEIDGEAIYQPNSKREIEALVQRLEDEGIAAVMSGVLDNFSVSDHEADKEAIKK